MSRAQKQLKRRHRKERKSQQGLRRYLRLGDGIVPDTDIDGSPGDVQLLRYDLTYDVMPDPNCPLSEVLSQDERERLFVQTLDDPAGALPKLQNLLARVPDSPILMNWLSRCHSALGNNAEAERISRLTLERNPDYLFARVNVAACALGRGELDQIPLIFDNKFDLKLLYPKRSTFHVTEYMSFASVMVEYYMRIGEQEAARSIFNVMEQIAPEHETTVRLRDLLETSLLLRAFRKALLLAGPGRLRW